MQLINKCVSGTQFIAYSCPEKRQVVVFTSALQVLSESECLGTTVGKANKRVKSARTEANRPRLWTEAFPVLFHAFI